MLDRGLSNAMGRHWGGDVTVSGKDGALLMQVGRGPWAIWLALAAPILDARADDKDRLAGEVELAGSSKPSLRPIPFGGLFEALLCRDLRRPQRGWDCVIGTDDPVWMTEIDYKSINSSRQSDITKTLPP